MAFELEKSSSHDAKVDTIEATEQTFSSDTEKAEAEEGDGKITFKTKMAVLVRHLPCTLHRSDID
jgi:hypothetical protein